MPGGEMTHDGVVVFKVSGSIAKTRWMNCPDCACMFEDGLPLHEGETKSCSGCKSTFTFRRTEEKP